jgi:hypothetical protein
VELPANRLVRLTVVVPGARVWTELTVPSTWNVHDDPLFQTAMKCLDPSKATSPLNLLASSIRQRHRHLSNELAAAVALGAETRSGFAPVPPMQKKYLFAVAGALITANKPQFAFGLSAAPLCYNRISFVPSPVAPRQSGSRSTERR